MSELVKARVDVIATTGDETVRVVQQATKTIPIVALVGDMLGSRLVTSLARPDGNTTGVSILSRDASGKRQDILIEAVPGLRLMAVLAHRPAVGFGQPCVTHPLSRQAILVRSCTIA